MEKCERRGGWDSRGGIQTWARIGNRKMETRRCNDGFIRWINLVKVGINLIFSYIYSNNNQTLFRYLRVFQVQHNIYIYIYKIIIIYIEDNDVWLCLNIHLMSNTCIQAPMYSSIWQLFNYEDDYYLTNICCNHSWYSHPIHSLIQILIFYKTCSTYSYNNKTKVAIEDNSNFLVENMDSLMDSNGLWSDVSKDHKPKMWQ